MNVRPLQAADVPACATLLAQRIPRWTRSRLADDVGRDGRHWLGAWRDGELIGVAGVWDAPDAAHLLALAVLPPYEGEGLAKQLLDMAIRDATARGLPAMTLEVRPSNARAIALYQSRGFVEVGCRRGYFDGDDALLMTCTGAA